MKRYLDWKSLLAIAVLLTATSARSVLAQNEAPAKDVPAETAEPDKAAATKFIRFRSVGDSEGVLETAVVTYRNEAGVEIDLISAVHIADRSYYEQLNKLFKTYDAVLYEMIKPEGVDPSQRAGGAVSFLQRTMKNVLELSFQLDAVDYKPKNFVHADMTPTSFSQAQKKNGESLFKLLFKSAMKQYSDRVTGDSASSLSFSEILKALMSDDSSRVLKYVFAREMQNIDRMMAGMEDSVIIAGRNKVAMSVLEKEIAAGKKKLAIFYGGAHMPDFERRFATLGFSPNRTLWLPAWDIRTEETKAKERAAATKKRREA